MGKGECATGHSKQGRCSCYCHQVLSAHSGGFSPSSLTPPVLLGSPKNNHWLLNVCHRGSGQPVKCPI